jgi:hypothetical protein
MDPTRDGRARARPRPHRPHRRTSGRLGRTGVSPPAPTGIRDDPTRDHLAALIERWGWAVVAVGTGLCDHPGCDGGERDDPVAYTIGLHAMRLPELIVRGFDAPTGQSILNGVARLMADGADVRLGQRIAVDGGVWVVTLASTRDRGDMRHARAFARGSGRRVVAWRLSPAG